MKDLDSLPMPAWDIIDMAPYKKNVAQKHRVLFYQLATTRGCPFKCTGCAKPIYGKGIIPVT